MCRVVLPEKGARPLVPQKALRLLQQEGFLWDREPGEEVVAVVENDPITGFTWDHPTPPFGIQEQLDFILPGRGKYPDELYEEGRDSRHKWMKAYSWETDPFISLPWNPMQEPTRIRTHRLT